MIPLHDPIWSLDNLNKTLLLHLSLITQLSVIFLFFVFFKFIFCHRSLLPLLMLTSHSFPLKKQNKKREIPPICTWSVLPWLCIFLYQEISLLTQSSCLSSNQPVAHFHPPPPPPPLPLPFMAAAMSRLPKQPSCGRGLMAGVASQPNLALLFRSGLFCK